MKVFIGKKIRFENLEKKLKISAYGDIRRDIKSKESELKRLDPGTPEYKELHTNILRLKAKSTVILFEISKHEYRERGQPQRAEKVAVITRSMNLLKQIKWGIWK